MGLAATPDERLFEGPPPSKFAARTRFVSILLVCFLAHAIPILLLLSLDRPDGLAPGEQEIPVEMVEEPPQKPPEPAPKAEQPPRKPTLDANFADDAPRAPNEEKPVKDAHDDVSHAPKPAQGDQAVKPTETSAPKAGAPPEAPEPQAPDATEQAKAEQPAPQPAPQEKNATPEPAAAPSAAPEYSFAPASTYAPVAGGKAASTYISIVYGMWLSHMRRPPAGRAHEQGEIVFGIDYGGSLTGAKILKSSGSRELDAAAMAAIKAASPFPLPPTGTGITMNLRYGD